jgi:hypothetical protein
LELSVQFHAPVTLTPEKEPVVPVGRKLFGTQNLFGIFGEEENISLLTDVHSRFISHPI